ncbi:MAG: TIGR00730 family Rossman fold protein, partial [Bacteroidota bacterium]
VMLVGTEYWAGMKQWIQETMADKEKTISPHDMDLIPIIDTPEEAIQIIRDFYDGQGHVLEPNYKL